MVTEEQKGSLKGLLIAVSAVVGAFFEAYAGIAEKVTDIIVNLFF